MWRTGWAMIFTAIALLEGVALGRPEPGDSLSETVQWFRRDPVGRWIVLPLWFWLTWHWILKRPAHPMFGWRDVLFLLAGFLLAYLETRR